MSRSASALSPCAALVRRDDPDRFFCILMTPSAVREGLFALAALETELARIPRRVSEPLLGAIRLQWWRDTLAGIAAGEPPRHDIAYALAEARATLGLDPMALSDAIDAWDAELDLEAPGHLDHLLGMLGATRGSFADVGLRLIGVDHEPAARIGRHVGIACGLTSRLLTMAERTARGEPALPHDVLARHGLDACSTQVGERSRRLAAATAEIADRAQEHISAVRCLAPSLSRQARTVLLPVSLAAHDLRRLRRLGPDVFSPVLARRGLGRQLVVMGHVATGRI